MKQYTIGLKTQRDGREPRTSYYTGTLDELKAIFSYELECGKAYEHERGNKRINLKPATVTSLVSNLNKAASNRAADGYASKEYFKA